jgi:hypothetical protein
MSRHFRFPSDRLQKLFKAQKRLREGSELKWKDEGTRGKSLKLLLDMVDGPFVDFILHASAGNLTDPTTYRAALVLEGERVRGVDYNNIERSKFYRGYIAKGWHENIIDPNLASTDLNRNRHLAIENFAPTDLTDFLRKLCHLWHIDLAFEEDLL